MDESRVNRIARFLAINRTVGIVLVSVLLFGVGEQLWQPFLPLFLKSESAAHPPQPPPFKGGSEIPPPLEKGGLGGVSAAQLSDTALWSIGAYACLLNLFQAFCYIGGGQLTARLGDRGSMFLFGSLTIAGYVIFLTVPHPWATVTACLLILGWESLSMPVTFTTVGATLDKDQRGMAFAVQSIQKRLPKIIGPICIGTVLYFLSDYYLPDKARLVAMPWLVGAALVLGLISMVVQWKWMPHRATPKIKGNMLAVLRQFPTNLRRLLLAEVLTRWCDWLVRELVVVYLATERGLSDPEIAGLITLQHCVAMITYLPVGRMTHAVGLQPFIGLTFVFFALFPLTLILVPNDWLWLAYIVNGMREIGEPARKAMITTSMPEAIRARGVGLYWGIRAFAVCSSALVGAWLWRSGGSTLLFSSAFALGVLGILVYYFFCQSTPDTKESA